MKPGQRSDTDLQQLITSLLPRSDFVRASFAGPKRGKVPFLWNRVEVRPVQIAGHRLLQFAFYETKKHITKNHELAAFTEALTPILDAQFSAISLQTLSERIEVRISKKGKMSLLRKQLQELPDRVDTSHDRVKERFFPLGSPDPVLELMGIITPEGRFRSGMQDKYAQINEFLKHLKHLLDASSLPNSGRPIRILDCGCGSSYLTIAAHHYLNDRLKLPAEVIGIDMNADVIRKSMERSQRISQTGPFFIAGAIQNQDHKADIVIALHACDTATDDALAQAIKSQATLILCVPCCHKHLNRQLEAGKHGSELHPLVRHGILLQRTADLLTDAFRAAILRIMGYRTDVVEFVPLEHTAKNLMIRGVSRTNAPPVADVQDYLSMKSYWKVTPYLEELLGEALQKRLRIESSK